MRTPVTLVAIVLLLQSLTSAEATEKRINGKITTVDARHRTITIDAVTVDVIRKTSITVQGEVARFANIKVGQLANVLYDDQLEFANIIAIRESAAKDEEKTAEDLKFLQGDWIGVVEEGAQGEVLNAAIVKERDRHLTISRNNFTMTRMIDGKKGAFTGKFEIDAATGQFDFVGKGPNGNLSEWIGIYEIKNDTWRVRYNFKSSEEAIRPVRMQSEEGEKSNARMYVFKRAAG